MLEFIAVTGAAPWAFWLALVALVVLGTMRLTRLITSDHVGVWMRRGVSRWADEYEESALQLLSLPSETTPREVLPHQHRVARRVADEVPVTWAKRLEFGLECPFCVGFHVGWVILAITWGTFYAPAFVAAAWLFVLSSLALNYVAGHVGARLD